MSAARRVGLTLLSVLALGCANDVYQPESQGLPLRFAVVEPQAVSEAETSALAAAFDIVDRYVIEVVDDATDAFVTSAEIDITPGLQIHDLDIMIPEEALGTTVRILLIAYSGEMEMYRATAVTTLSDTVGTTEVDLEIRYSGPGIRGKVVNELGAVLPGVSVSLQQGESVIDAVPTEPDGTYLFVDVAVGQYEIRALATGEFDTRCPPFRTVTVDAADASVVANFLVRQDNASCGQNVLVVSGGDFDDTAAVEALFADEPDVSTESFFFVNQTPGLAQLRTHDVVLLFANGLFDESVALGDEIAQYVNLGGNVVIASFYWQVRGGSPLGAGWGALEAMDPFTSSGGATYLPGTLGTVNDPGHPLANGLQTVTSTGFWGGVTAKSTTSVVASWANGDPYIGYTMLPGGQRIVGVSLFPASGTSATGDWQTVFVTAVEWAGEAGWPVPD